ncbi:hypothetical protein E5J99_02495 [Hymenobacter elongatus]|uniref:Outer membrane protein beta-barrel domain-containing protein n=2 Tax=Hymenobacter elongatus TaxID=877208 RepID=A0A4Z0PPL5_9BACT|nr:hypothetical protein E5J99_02495 [Hymenobacter elongatus]
MAFGVSLVGNINFSAQAYPAKGARFQKNSYPFPTGELLASYTWPHGWRLESGLGFGSVAAVTIDAREQFGRAATVSFGTVQVPLRLYHYLSLGSKSRYSVSPHIGVQVVSLSTGQKTSARYPIYPGKPDYGSQSKWFRSVQNHTLTYQTGLSINYISPKLELNAFVRYTNSFGNPVAAEGKWEYDLQGVEQPPLYSTSRLENVAVGVVVRRTFFAR